MRGHVLCEMNVPFGHRFGSGRHGPFGPSHFNFGRPYAFEAIGFGFGPHFGRHEHRRHGHRSCCEDSSPERGCGRGRPECGSPGRHERGFEGPRHGHEHHRGPHREGPPRGPRGPSGPHGPPGWHGPGHYGGPHWGGWSSARGPHGSSQPGPYGPPSCPEHHGGTHSRGPPPCFGDWCPRFDPQCSRQEHSEGHQCHNKRPCCSQGRKPRGPNEKSSGESCRRRCRRVRPRGECCRNSDSSPERHGRHGPHRRCRSKPHFGPSSCDRCENRPSDNSNRHQNATNECVIRDDRADDIEEHGENHAPGILVQNIVVDNNPGSNSV